IQTVNLGTAPTGDGGDTFRSTGAKINENFTNPSHAASRYVGTAAGNVMEVGAFGLGLEIGIEISGQDLNLGSQYKAGNYSGDTLANSPYPKASGIYNYLQVNNLSSGGASLYQYQEITAANHSTGNERYYRLLINGGWTSWRKYLTSVNTTVDANGFIKAASPIVKLFADKIELNNEAAEQNITFEKLDVGHYLLKGTSGLATEGWYIETPKDANGNILFAVIYQQLENKDIEIKTFKKKFDVESASIIADLDNPVDISTG
ncbi:pyocin knob domain-containing protein, partial [Acinetobacter baumannii]